MSTDRIEELSGVLYAYPTKAQDTFPLAWAWRPRFGGGVWLLRERGEELRELTGSDAKAQALSALREIAGVTS